MNLNAPHLHLLINHVPVFFFLFAAAALAWGWWRSDRSFQVAGAALCLLGALATQAAIMTGERSEDIVESLPGVDEAVIEKHEEAAEFARWTAVPAGALGLVLLWFAWSRRPPPRALLLVGLLASLLTFAVLARVTLLGGEVRHTEIRPGVAADAPADRD